MILLAELVDTVEKTIGYGLRVRTGGPDARMKDAEIQTPPGYYTRPNDANESTVGTDDVVLVEFGDYRLVLCSHNSKGWKNLLDYLTRALDKGETVITAEDGTARTYLSFRPDGTMKAMSDDGGGNTCEATLDPAGNIDLVVTGKTRIGGAAATSAICRTVELLADFNTAVVGKVALYNTHTHNDSLGAPTTAPLPAFLWGNIPATIESGTGETD